MSDGETERLRLRKRIVRRHTDLEVFKRAFRAAMRIFKLSKEFPPEERYSLTDQVRRSSRSVCTCIAEAWRRRKYPAAFVNKLNEGEAEAAETQVWIQFSVGSQYITRAAGAELYQEYNAIMSMLVDMGRKPEQWGF